MTLVRSRLLLVAMSAGLMLATSPAFAWVCTAKNARGALYSSVGLFQVPTQNRAVAKCRAGSVYPNTCVIVSCKP